MRCPVVVPAKGGCPRCGCPSSRIHDRYRRQLHGLGVPLAARRIHIVVEVRRFVLGVSNQTGLFTTIREALGLR